MKRCLTALFVSAAALLAAAPPCFGISSVETEVFSPAPEVSLDDVSLSLPGSVLRNWTTYVPLRALTAALRPESSLSWENGEAVLEGEELPRLVFRAGEECFWCNGTEIGLTGPILAANGSLLIPLRPLAAVLGAETDWNPDSGATLSTQASEDLYWLSRIISAESRGEPFEGQIAVGNVVLNRVASPDFPDTIYDVIFDERWGGQFAPVRNGSIWNEPAESSVLAARLCLAGATTAAASLYFIAPNLTSNHWVMEQREFVTTIGAHYFYR